MHLSPPPFDGRGTPGTISIKFYLHVKTDGQGTNGLENRNIAENFNLLSRAHERYRQTDGQIYDDI